MPSLNFDVRIFFIPPAIFILTTIYTPAYHPPMTRVALSRRLKALADPMRLRILALLPVGDRCEDVYNVSELAKEIGITQPSVSHHLRVLRAADLVQSKRMCHDVYYWIDSRQIELVRISLGAISNH